MAEIGESLPRLLGGRYRLEARLGRGGMGIVYRATDTMMQRPVAVKLIHFGDDVSLDEDVAGRFDREAKNTARLQHEHIIEIYDLGRSEDGDLFLVMELLQGESIATRLKRIGRFSAEDTVHIAKQICAALHVAHTAGIIHRDLKPANVMLVRRGENERFVKVLDFGVAKSYAPDQQTQLTHTGMLVGTIDYMAPEQIMGRTVDGRTDVYSLGVVLYRMLAGKPPFKEGSVPSVIHAHINLTPPPLREIVPDVPPSIDRAVMRALAKQAEDRFPSMLEFARALAKRPDPTTALVDLEYAPKERPDPYEIGEQTEVGRKDRADEDPTFDRRRRIDDDEPFFEDPTIKLARGQAPLPPNALAKPRPSTLKIDQEETAMMVPPAEDPTAKRAQEPAVRAAPPPAPPKACAMCHTLNPPHARACSACGVSLATEEQEAVRARVTAPRPLPPPPVAPPPPPMIAYAPPPTGGWHAPAPTHLARPGLWQRFLAWAGLRPR